jgi:hypothetical protein
MDETLQKLTEDKNIILVGNSVEMLEYEYGEYIENFDTIVRFGNGIPDEHTESLGIRTDIWITGWLRAVKVKYFPTAYKLFNRCRIHLDIQPKDLTPPFEHETMFNDDELKKIYKMVGAENNVKMGNRPSAGFLGILFFLTKTNPKSITLIGFDFFSKKLPFKSGNDYPSSWHLPHNSQESSPHNNMEKPLVQKWANEGKLEWKILSDLNEEFLDFT